MPNWAQRRKGYFKALLDLHNYFDSVSDSLKYRYRGANRAAAMLAVVKLLLEDKQAFEWFMKTGGLDGHISIQEKANKKSKEYVAVFRQ